MFSSYTNELRVGARLRLWILTAAVLFLGLAGLGGVDKAEAASTTTLELRAYVPNGSGYRIDPNAYIAWTGGWWIKNDHPVRFTVTKGSTFTASAYATREVRVSYYAVRHCARRSWNLSIPRNAGSVVKYNLLLTKDSWRFC